MGKSPSWVILLAMAVEKEGLSGELCQRLMEYVAINSVGESGVFTLDQ